ncbi:MAG TPA: peptidoglycan DD-metalloendopeptidase family protein [Vicinamibacterales bacterium]|nr:peptidoglycan DD-metalloendopeptidase family protein [Vicinamibacterales bacterium]
MRAAAASRGRRRAFLVLLAVLAGHVDATIAQEIAVELRSRSLQPGEAVVVTVSTPADTGTVAVAAFDAQWPTVRIGETRWRALVGIDLDRKPGTYPLTVDTTGTRELHAHEALAVRPKRFRRRALTVAPDFVNPPPELLARITGDTEFLNMVYRHSTDSAAWLPGFTRPVPDRANSSFGTRSVFNGQPRNPHAGTDFLSAAGTPVHAPAGGRVVAARDLFFTGNTVVIDHGWGVFSMLAHLSRLDVIEGTAVSEGDIVGLVGATGRVTGPHLHWALRIGAARVDPLSALAVLGTSR